MTDELSRTRAVIQALTLEEKFVLRRYLQQLAPYDLEQRWGVGADVILDAIEMSSDLTKRGLRGILAEAIFESDVIPRLDGGWSAAPINRNEDLPYDSLLIRGADHVRVQVKLQRTERGEPKLFYPKHYEKGSLYVVEVQKTRTGRTFVRETLPDSDEQLKVVKSTSEDTRPYRFGQFDILAVNMHPSTNDWKSFRYTLDRWLLARPEEPTKIAVFQPVSKMPNDIWTDDLTTCLRWFKEGEQKSVLANPKHLIKRPTKG